MNVAMYHQWHSVLYGIRITHDTRNPVLKSCSMGRCSMREDAPWGVAAWERMLHSLNLTAVTGIIRAAFDQHLPCWLLLLLLAAAGGCWLLLGAAAAAAGCCWLLLAAAEGCCCWGLLLLLAAAAAAGCCCWLLLLLLLMLLLDLQLVENFSKQVIAVPFPRQVLVMVWRLDWYMSLTCHFDSS